MPCTPTLARTTTLCAQPGGQLPPPRSTSLPDQELEGWPSAARSVLRLIWLNWSISAIQPLMLPREPLLKAPSLSVNTACSDSTSHQVKLSLDQGPSTSRTVLNTTIEISAAPPASRRCGGRHGCSRGRRRTPPRRREDPRSQTRGPGCWYRRLHSQPARSGSA